MSDFDGLEGLALLGALARQLPDVGEGVACEGTAVEKRTFHVRGKNFLFLGPCAGGFTAMFKLVDALPEAQALAAARPDRCKVGVHGWVTVTVPHDEGAPEALARWIAESRRAVLPRPKPARGA